MNLHEAANEIGKGESKVEAQFRAKTAEGLLRHPAFKGGREDLC